MEEETGREMEEETGREMEGETDERGSSPCGSGL
jgi:hypothetical protein